ncbi:hypothetical protein [Megasphaera elsdenii]|uniref:hypothetical protein n=1 Tax=Megasphaera elsdenii TaxID=907 RepID=UPI00242E69AC|nr:hypothetical protein [Megasphaera elsdenii]
MGKIETLKALATLQLAYPTDMSMDRLDLYVNKLGDVPPDLLASAVDYCINHCRLLPSIAEIRETAEQAAGLAMGETTKDSAADAWGRVQKAIAAVGYTGKPDFSDDPILAKVVEHFGWKQICMTPVDDTSILRAQFRKAYEAACQQRKNVRDFSQAGVPINPRIRQAIAAEMTATALPGGKNGIN